MCRRGGSPRKSEAARLSVFVEGVVVLRTITGRHNVSLKLARRLQKKRYRVQRGFFVAEGWDLLEAALAAGVRPVELLVREDLAGRIPEELTEGARGDRLDIAICSADALAEVSTLGGAADVVAVFRERRASLNDWDLSGGVTVFLYQVGDPGNVGTLCRSALAFGAAGVACSPRTADAFGSRALRAGMGAQFLLPVATEVAPDDLLGHVAARTGRGESHPVLVVTDPRGTVPAFELSRHLGGDRAQEPGAALGRSVGSKPGVVLVLGSERGELPSLAAGPWRARVEVAVPQARFDSLNVAMAGTVVLYELSLVRRDMHAGRVRSGDGGS